MQALVHIVEDNITPIGVTRRYPKRGRAEFLVRIAKQRRDLLFPQRRGIELIPMGPPKTSCPLVTSVPSVQMKTLCPSFEIPEIPVQLVDTANMPPAVNRTGEADDGN